MTDLLKDYPLGKVRYTITELNEKVTAANKHVREVSPAPFALGYWEGVRDERLRLLRLKKYLKD